MSTTTTTTPSTAAEMPTSTTKHRPGLMLVHPLLRSPDGLDTSDLFLRWTKMHYRDLLDIPWTREHGRFVRTCRFATPPTSPSEDANASPSYSHANHYSASPFSTDSPPKHPVYVYTSHVEDIGIVRAQPYYDVSRKLNVEETRALKEGEEGVGGKESGREGLGEGSMVFEICDAGFAIWELRDSGE
ncbi:hypothetical protein BDV95DRAFT_102678 [Massariosphaeria phaeospora]|uniref:Uncharacterized protein n=1 Tax=Massariosphaeria phaeospora TaxID=100035 RepID=A0A7C8I2Z8_9PLEO|nr:hypothetical protein BDV95DRAFT_102678 [Massariosphaeria phaeospora]